MTPDTALKISALSAGYGHVEVLRDINLEVRAGELVTIIGSNGAGKSTLLKAIVGLLPLWKGSVWIEGSQVHAMTPEKAVRSGVALVPEGRMLFGTMSVDENLELGAYSVRGAAAGSALARAFELFPVLEERRSQTAATLSGGEQQMLAVARALMSSPRLLLLDEPSLGLAPKVIAEIFRALDVLRAGGITIVLVEQDARLALKHADRGYVMRTGEIALGGTAAELLSNDDVRQIYLGGWNDSNDAGPAKV